MMRLRGRLWFRRRYMVQYLQVLRSYILRQKEYVKQCAKVERLVLYAA